VLVLGLSFAVFGSYAADFSGNASNPILIVGVLLLNAIRHRTTPFSYSKNVPAFVCRILTCHGAVVNIANL
jgi:hypothetical protein